MFVDLEIRLEATDDGKVVWWATSADLPGFSCAADSLDELRRLTIEAATDLLEEGNAFEGLHEKLVGTSVRESHDSDFELRTMPFVKAAA